MDTADGSPTRNLQLSHRDMFGCARRGSETRPSVYSSVTLPESPAPSTSNDSGAGYNNGSLQYGPIAEKSTGQNLFIFRVRIDKRLGYADTKFHVYNLCCSFIRVLSGCYRSEWHIQDGGQLLKKTAPFLPAIGIVHKSETSTATKFEMARPIFPRKCFLLFLALCDL